MHCKRPSCSGRSYPGKYQGFCEKHYQSAVRGYVDAQECIDHVEALHRQGHSWREISALTGLHVDTLRSLGQWAGGRVQRSTYVQIMSVPVPEEIVGGSAIIPNVGTRRRLQALALAGFSQERLGVELGYPASVVGRWTRGNAGITSGNVEKVRVVFDRLQLVRGPSSLTALRARNKGWIPALHWDEDTIDDPNAEPYVPEVIVDEWHDDFRELCSMGLSQRHAAERMGIKWSTLQRRLERLRAAA